MIHRINSQEELDRLLEANDSVDITADVSYPLLINAPGKTVGLWSPGVLLAVGEYSLAKAFSPGVWVEAWGENASAEARTGGSRACAWGDGTRADAYGADTIAEAKGPETLALSHGVGALASAYGHGSRAEARYRGARAEALGDGTMAIARVLGTTASVADGVTGADAVDLSGGEWEAVPPDAERWRLCLADSTRGVLWMLYGCVALPVEEWLERMDELCAEYTGGLAEKYAAFLRQKIAERRG